MSNGIVASRVTAFNAFNTMSESAAVVRDAVAPAAEGSLSPASSTVSNHSNRSVGTDAPHVLELDCSTLDRLQTVVRRIASDDNLIPLGVHLRYFEEHTEKADRIVALTYRVSPDGLHDPHAFWVEFGASTYHRTATEKSDRPASKPQLRNTALQRLVKCPITITGTGKVIAGAPENECNGFVKIQDRAKREKQLRQWANTTRPELVELATKPRTVANKDEWFGQLEGILRRALFVFGNKSSARRTQSWNGCTVRYSVPAVVASSRTIKYWQQFAKLYEATLLKYSAVAGKQPHQDNIAELLASNNVPLLESVHSAIEKRLAELKLEYATPAK